jgi:hypothetical protein
MAEFCKSCADKFGMQNDNPTLCEGCGQSFVTSPDYSFLYFVAVLVVAVVVVASLL